MKKNMSNSISFKMEPKRLKLFTHCFLPMMLTLAAVIFIGNALVITNYKERQGWGSFVALQIKRSLLCQTQPKPNGSEALPGGIISKTSDLELRSLWSPKSKQNRKLSMNLLAIAVGTKQKDSVNKIVKKFPESEFVVMLFHYDGIVDSWKDLEWNERAIHVSAVNQTKWWFAKRFLHPDIVSEYAYVFLWDEDLGVEDFNAKRYLSIINEEGLEISQPAIVPGRKSELHHPITARNNETRVHRRVYKDIGHTKCSENSTGPPCTGFVEMMAPVFSIASWRCAWHLVQNDLIYGWGVDFQLGYCAQGDRTKNIGIVDNEYLVHDAFPTLGGLEEDKEPSKKHEPKKTESTGRSKIRNLSYLELETFKHRWRQAIRKDDCWIDPYEH